MKVMMQWPRHDDEDNTTMTKMDEDNTATM